MRKGINTFLILVIAYLFNGCVTWQNGIRIQDKDDIAQRSNVNIYIDNQATLMAEKEFLNYAKEILSEGTVITRNYKKSEEVIDYKKTNSNKTFFIAHYGRVQGQRDLDFDVDLLVDNISYDEMNKLFFSTVGEKKEKKIKMDFDVINRTLVSKKKYLDQRELFIDFLHISSALRGEMGLKLAKKTGYQFLILEGNALKDNKLVLKPLTEKFSYKDEVERVFTSYGYKTVSNKEKSDIVIETEVVSFAVAEALKNTNRVSNLFSMSRADASASKLAMDFASLSGSSSSGAAAIGLALFALDFLSSDKSKHIAFNTVSSIYKKGNKDSKNISVVRPAIFTYRTPWHISDQAKQHEKQKFNGMMGRNVESLVKFVERGGTKRKGDRILVESEIHEDGLIDIN